VIGEKIIYSTIEECSEIRERLIKLARENERILRSLYDENLDEIKGEIRKFLRTERDKIKRREVRKDSSSRKRM